MYNLYIYVYIGSSIPCYNILWTRIVLMLAINNAVFLFVFRLKFCNAGDVRTRLRTDFCWKCRTKFGTCRAWGVACAIWCWKTNRRVSLRTIRFTVVRITPGNICRQLTGATWEGCFWCSDTSLKIRRCKLTLFTVNNNNNN